MCQYDTIHFFLLKKEVSKWTKWSLSMIWCLKESELLQDLNMKFKRYIHFVKALENMGELKWPNDR